jgi:hypothetical protein
MNRTKRFAEDAVRFLEVALFIAMVPLMPVTVWLMFLALDRLGIGGGH